MHAYTYLSFPGTGAEALTYYQYIFGGELELTTYGELTGAFPFDPPADALAHGTLVADGLSLAGGDDVLTPTADALDSHAYSFLLNYATVAEAENMLAKFTASGADLTMPLAPVAWGAHYGQVTDRYGVLWAVNVPAGSDPAAG
ncbi:hypothetical protein B841_11450 [Corynebacterium maris DSM 45190]|uniref:Glyoxalase/fosfomycin resistance/dioxygenase domain-containing protein n=1 Tax=Corynebacterium maris DSM 45190 TaxID=1224163 RepID=S5SXB0_9CORY|nr:VOC family protein [Corynebacterium maris]AGS35762.1 hypothetical protein B841_11450 [Corynebacterium maris DSM 45190]